LVLIANAEIYNYIEIRKQLEIRGHTFRTNSDCEVIPHLYEEYGNACIHYLRGMFAFALWNTRTNKLLLARDRIGEKPLYLYETSNSILFASELKALLHSGVIPFYSIMMPSISIFIISMFLSPKLLSKVLKTTCRTYLLY